MDDDKKRNRKQSVLLKKERSLLEQCPEFAGVRDNFLASSHVFGYGDVEVICMSERRV